MKIEIKSWLDDGVLFEGEFGSLKVALEAAVSKGVKLHYARLDGARLDGARLVGARLVGARLDGASLDGASLDGARLVGAKNLRLPTGETWEEYLTETVPALLTAGGKKLEEVATPEHWACHDWSNCPVAAAFGVDDAEKVPPLYRMQAKQFVTLFDSGNIPLEKVNPKAGKVEA